jgi:hypothetical protein
MRRCGGVGRVVRGLALAGLLTLCGTPAGMAARAFEPPPGSKNFTAPSSVPNYFSNEAAPFRRGPQTAAPGADRFNTAPARTGSSHAAVAPPTPDTAASAGRGTHQSTPARGGTARSKQAASRTAGRTGSRKAQSRPASVQRPARTASRKPAATKPRAAASRARPAGNTRHAGRTAR